MMRVTWRQALLYAGMGVCFGLIAHFLLRPAGAQDVHHHVGMSQDVDKFYSTWRVPNRGADRVSSCCNRTDCAPAQIKLKDGKWYGRRDMDVDWHYIPDSLLESNQGDPRESPDGGSHICVNGNGMALCAVLGSGQ